MIIYITEGGGKLSDLKRMISYPLYPLRVRLNKEALGWEA